jgi:hypothetical protein
VLLWLAHVAGAPPAAVGQIVTISSNVKSINAATATFGLADGNIYVVANASVLMINGKRGKISDLEIGQKVTGTAEIAPPDVPRTPPKKVIRMINATADPTFVRANPAASPPLPSQSGAPVPAPPSMVTQEEKDWLTTKLAGTFWTIPKPGRPNTPAGKQWLSLNPDGTTTSEASDQPGTWRAVGGLVAQVSYFNEDSVSSTTLRFSPGVNRADDTRYSHYPPMMLARSMPGGLEALAWILNSAPTPEMLSKVRAHSRPTSSGASSPTAPPTSPDTQQAASEIIKRNRSNLVFVTGKQGAGSGFIANMEGTSYLVSNAHVAAGIDNAGFKTLDGTALQGGAAGVAIGHDIFRMVLPPGGTPFEVMKDVDQNAGVGDNVVVLGNAEGSGVINTIMGRIVGIGPNLVEIDAQFVPGNSGSPIVHLNTGKVVGVATYTVTQTYDTTTKEKMKAPVIRRFGYRLDSVKTWQPVQWQTFYAQANAIERVVKLTEALDDFFRDLYENKNRVTKARHTNPIIATRVSQWLDSKGRNRSATDRENADANFISFLKIACQSDLANAQRGLTYDYFQRRLAKEQEIRNEMSKAFTEIIKNIRE